MSNINNDPLISVIVPIYKVQEYLHRCVDSIINQTYKNLEIILVDDGSPDDCGKICEEYAKKDNRIKVYHKQNGGLSDARNYGLNYANGEYIGFVDSDDFIHPRMYEILIHNMINCNAEVSTCCRKVTFEDNIDDNLDTQSCKISLLNNKEAVCNLFTKGDIVMHAAWEKLYRKDIFEDIRFPKGELYEDQAIMYLILHKCHKIVAVDTPLYYWYMRDGSITHSKYSQKSILDQIKHPREALEYFKQNDVELLKYARFYYVNMIEKLYAQCINNNDYNMAKEIYSDYRNNYDKLDELKVLLGKKQMLFYHFPKLTIQLQNLKSKFKKGVK